MDIGVLKLMIMNQETKTCQNCNNKFTIEPEDFVFLEKVGIPSPKKCVTCIWKQLLSFWVFGRFRKTKSDLSGKGIITNFPETVQFPIYERKEWVSDDWDPMQYGREYDSSRSFFKQIKELQVKVPHPHQFGTQNVRCEWSDDVWKSKDCYLCRSLLDCEHLSYGYRTWGCKNSVDITYCFDIELSYDCLYCFKCYKVKYSFNARDCLESDFLYDCRNVQNCFMCWNLRNKQYYILNKPYSREEYFDKLKEFDLSSYNNVQKIKKEFQEIVARKAVHRANFNVKVVNSEGNFLTECKNCISCYFYDYSENCRHNFRGVDSKDSIYSVGGIIEKCVLSAVDGYLYETVVTSHSAYCRYSAYLDYCEDCEYCFGCVGLRKKKYCILNKQYKKESFDKLRARIIKDMKQRGEWGEFFPYAMAPCGYNFSLAHIYFPETKESVEKLGGFWEEVQDVEYEGISGNDLPDCIDEVDESISKQAIICPETKLRFNIAPHELTFYKEHGIPLPRRHFDWRTLERFKPLAMMITPRSGRCFFCSQEITHFYPPEWNYQKIACEKCYLKEVV